MIHLNMYKHRHVPQMMYTYVYCNIYLIYLDAYIYIHVNRLERVREMYNIYTYRYTHDTYWELFAWYIVRCIYIYIFFTSGQSPFVVGRTSGCEELSKLVAWRFCWNKLANFLNPAVQDLREQSTESWCFGVNSWKLYEGLEHGGLQLLERQTHSET